MSFDDIATLVDLERYPIDQLDFPAGNALVKRPQADLAGDGATSLPQFLNPDALSAFADEAEGLVPLAYRGPTDVSPYFFKYDITGPRITPHARRAFAISHRSPMTRFRATAYCAACTTAIWRRIS